MNQPALTPTRIFDIALAFQQARVVLSALELGLFSELAAGPLAADVLRERLGLDPRGARDFFDALVALGLLDREDGSYANTAESDLFLDRDRPTYVGEWLARANVQGYRTWGALTEALRSGQPQTETRGNFDVTYRDPARLRRTLEAMTGHSQGVAQAIAGGFPWADYRTFLDVGTAQGALPVQLALAHPHLTGGGFDLAPVGSFFDEYVGSFGLSDRLCFYPGDFFTDPLPLADVMLMGHILHNWGLDGKRSLLANAYQALAPGGFLIVYDYLIDDQRREDLAGLLMSLNMLLNTADGFGYSGAECSAWMGEAGFRDLRIQPLSGPQSMVVGRK